jgi:hypothetical protein
MNICTHLLPVPMNYYYSLPQPRNPPGFGGGVFFHNLHNRPPVLIPHKKPPMVTNQPEFSLFNNPDYFGFYSKNDDNNNIPIIPITPSKKEKNENTPPIPKLIFTDLNIESQEFRPGREWSPRSGGSTNSNNSSPRSIISNISNISTISTNSNNSSPRSIITPRKRVVVYSRIRKRE